MQERRVRRSSEKQQALELYLQSVKNRARAETVVFADQDGLVVSGTGTPEQNEIVAICGTTPALAQDFANSLPGKVRAEEIRVEGSRYYLAWIGSGAVAAEEAAAALTRILFADCGTARARV